MSDLNQKLEQVQDEQSFVAFLRALAEDKRNNPESWEWDKIEAFLEASAAWAEDTKNGTKRYGLPDNIWMRLAEIIYCGKVYE